MEINPYAAPTPEPVAQVQPAVGGQPLTLEQILKEAWRLTRGFKGVAWGATLVVGVVTYGAQFLLELLTVSASSYAMQGDFVMQIVTGFWQGLAILPLTAPLYGGVAMLALHRARGEDVEFSTVFAYFDKLVPLTIVGLIVMVGTYLGYALLLIPGIYLVIALVFSNWLVVDRGLGPWEAVKTSLKTVHPHWFHVFGVFVVSGLILGASALALGIGLIWTMPWLYLVMAVLYRSLFESAPTTSSSASPSPQRQV